MSATAKLLARFPDYDEKGTLQVYMPSERRSLGTPEVYASGEGSSRRIAVTRAVRAMFKHPALFHKTPDYISIEIVTDDTMPFRHELPRR
jgi:hypothetical protein